MKRFIEFTGGTLQALEFVTFVCSAAALVLIGPVLWSYQLFNGERIYAAVIVAILWLASLVTLGNEIQGKAITSNFRRNFPWLVGCPGLGLFRSICIDPGLAVCRGMEMRGGAFKWNLSGRAKNSKKTKS
jgi:hypothetical protein